MIQLLRNRSILVIVGLLIAGALIGSAQDRARVSRSSFLLQDTIQTLLAPVNSLAHGFATAANRSVRAARPRSAILRENAGLRKDVRRLIAENAGLRDAEAENARLRELLGLRSSSNLKTIAAEVISRKESSWFDTLTIDRGRSAGVAPGAAVLNHLGLIGQVVEVGPFTAQVVALTDSSSAIGAMVRRSRSCGMIMGQGANGLILTYLPKDADVKRADIIVSSGMGKAIPKGLVIGRVIRVARNPVAGVSSALVRPSVRFDQAQQVLVVVGYRL